MSVFVLDFRFDAMLCSNLWNENSDVGHVHVGRICLQTSGSPHLIQRVGVKLGNPCAQNL